MAGLGHSPLNRCCWRKNCGRLHLVQEHILIGLQTGQSILPAFAIPGQDRYCLDSTRDSWPTLGLERQPQPPGQSAQSLHLIRLALDRGRFLPNGARFACKQFSADSEEVCCRRFPSTWRRGRASAAAFFNHQSIWVSRWAIWG